MSDFIDTEVEQAEVLDYDYYGLKVYQIGNKEYAVGTDAECNEAVEKYIENTLWAFNTDFINDQLGLDLDEDGVKSLQTMQSKCCDSCNTFFRQLIGDKFDDFVDAAVCTDGRGHFLASYDGEEIDSDDVDGLPKGLIAYRIN